MRSQCGAGRSDRGHDHSAGIKCAGGLGDDIRPSPGGEHQVGPQVLAPLVVLPTVQQRRSLQDRFCVVEASVVDESTGEGNAGVGRLGDRDREIGTGLDGRREHHAQAVRLAAQAGAVAVEHLHGHQGVVPRRDSAQPGIGHRGVRVGGIVE